MSKEVPRTRAMTRGARGLSLAGFVLLVTPEFAWAEPSTPAEGDRESSDEASTRPVHITPPKALDASATYPQGARGNHEVVLELIVRRDGSVERATAIRGDAPFSEVAERAARGWSFEPALSGAQPVKAKIRFLVTFVEPEAQTDESAESPQTTSPAPGSDEVPQPTPPKPPTPIAVEVWGQRPDQTQQLTQAEIRELPGAFGDPFRSLDVLPGVVPIVSGLPYFYVRGAPPGNVGYLFDGIPVPALFHFAAGPGVLHPAFVENIDLYAGAYPARYGRYTGGVAEGTLASPQHEWRGEASVRLVDSGGMVEAPFDDGRGSVMLGGRYSYTAQLLTLLDSNITVNYWDYQSRIRYELDDDDALEIFAFGSGDYFNELVDPDINKRETAIDLDFHRVDLRWDRSFERGRFRQALLLGLDNTRLDTGKLRFENRLIGTRSEFSHDLGDDVTLRTGADLTFERLDQTLKKSLDQAGTVDEEVTIDENGNEVVVNNDEEGSDLGLDFDRRRDDYTFGAFLDFVIDAAPGIEVTPGFRSDVFVSGDRYAVGLDPRIAARFRVARGVTLTHGLGVAHQRPAFLVPLPGLQPSIEGGLQRAVQHYAGVEYGLGLGIQSSLVLFQNLFFNMNDSLGLEQLNETQGEDAYRANGRAVGAEVMLRRSLVHDLGGFLSYTLSRSERSVARLEGPAASDRTHVVNLAASYNLGANWRVGTRFVFYSGPPASVSDIEAAKDPPRAPPFWRLDWRLQKRWLIANGPGYWGFVVEVLNTTLNKEVLGRDCTEDPCVDEAIGPVTIPSIGVEAAF